MVVEFLADMAHDFSESCGVDHVERARARQIDVDRFGDVPRVGLHHVDPVGEDHCLGDRVGDEESRRLALHADALKLHVHEVAGQLVERRKGFVEKEHGRVGDQHPASRRALRHPAGQLARIGIGRRAQSDELEQLPCPRHRRAGRGASAPDFDRQHDVLDRGFPRQERRLLKHHSDVRPRAHHRPMFEHDPPGGGRNESGHDLQQRGLATTGGADDRRELPLAEDELHILESEEPVARIDLRQPLDLVDRPMGIGRSRFVGFVDLRLPDYGAFHASIWALV